MKHYQPPKQIQGKKRLYTVLDPLIAIDNAKRCNDFYLSCGVLLNRDAKTATTNGLEAISDVQNRMFSQGKERSTISEVLRTTDQVNKAVQKGFYSKYPSFWFGVAFVLDYEGFVVTLQSVEEVIEDVQGMGGIEALKLAGYVELEIVGFLEAI